MLGLILEIEMERKDGGMKEGVSAGGRLRFHPLPECV